MARYHINKHGVPAVCSAKVNACPLGTHFDTLDEATVFVETNYKRRYGILNSSGQILEIEIPEGFNKYGDNKKIGKEGTVSNYYQSPEALAFFEQNKEVVLEDNFDLMMISWVTNKEVSEGFEYNKIGKANYTYGDVVKILEQEAYSGDKDFNIKDRYLNGEKYQGSNEPHYHHNDERYWEEEMVVQKIRYSHLDDKVAKRLGIDNVDMYYLPMEARERLQRDGYLCNAQDLSNVIYKSEKTGNLITYNHKNGRVYKEFDSYEVAGVVEGHTINDYANKHNTQKDFDSNWENHKEENNLTDDDYEEEFEKYRDKQFMRGISRLEVPRAFAKFSPLAAQEIKDFTNTHKSIERVIDRLMGNESPEDDENTSQPYSMFRKSTS